MNLKNPTFWIIFILLTLVTFAPRMYEGLPLFPDISEIARILDPISIATVLLAVATFLMADDSSKNIEISKNNLIGQYLIKEMEELIKPLYENRKNFESLEYVYAYDLLAAIDFWKKREADKYLASKGLRKLIEEYMIINNEKYEEFKSINKKFWIVYYKERERCQQAASVYGPAANKYEKLKDFIYVELNIINPDHHLPRSSERDSWLQKIDELVKELEPDNEIRRYIEELKYLVNDDTSKNKREALVKMVETRYEELERKIDEIHESLDREQG